MTEPPSPSQDQANLTWSDLLARFLRSRDRHDWAERVPRQQPEWGSERIADPQSHADTPIPMGYLRTSYVESFATVQWQRSVLHLTIQDSKTGAGDDSEDLPIPPDWLADFLTVPWPVTDAQPWF